MSDNPARIEKRQPPTDPSAIRAAKLQPGAHLYDIDRPYPANQRTPPEAIRGSWQIDGEGILTADYDVNERYRPITHPNRTLKAYMHAAARTKRDQWMVEIDPRGENLFPNIPDYFIRGWWYVDKHGEIIDKFRPNSQWVDDGLSTSSN